MKEPLLIRIEKVQADWLKKESKKKKISIASIIRYWVDYAMNHEGL